MRMNYVGAFSLWVLAACTSPSLAIPVSMVQTMVSKAAPKDAFAICSSAASTFCLNAVVPKSGDKSQVTVSSTPSYFVFGSNTNGCTNSPGCKSIVLASNPSWYLVGIGADAYLTNNAAVWGGTNQFPWSLYFTGRYPSYSTISPGSDKYFASGDLLVYTGSKTDVIAPPSNGTEFSVICQAGYSVNSNLDQDGLTTACRECTAGTYNDENTESSTCSGCPAGEYSAAPGASSCKTCATGSYSLSFSTSCSNCQAGTFAAEGASSCTSCPAGSYSAAGAHSCKTCSAGTYAAAGATSCTKCAAGSFSASRGASSCSLCPAYSFASKAGATKCHKCVTGCTTPGANSCPTPTPKAVAPKIAASSSTTTPKP